MSTIASHRGFSYELGLRAALVVAIAVAAVAHIPVIAPHLDEAPYMGVLFIVFTVACFGLGVAVALTGKAWAYLASVAVCGAGVVTYAATRLVAFPQLSDDVGNWFEPLGVVSVISEAVVVALALLVLQQRRRAH